MSKLTKQTILVKKYFQINTWTVIFLLSQYFTSFAQLVPPVREQTKNYIFRHIDQSDGLLHNRVSNIVQDGKGYIWIMTVNGLQRYDGSRFVNYPYNPDNPGGITYDINCELFADHKNNRLWIAGETIEKFDLQKNKFTAYSIDEILKDSSFLFSEYKDSFNETWYAGPFGVVREDNGIQKIRSYLSTAPWLAPAKSNDIFFDPGNGEIWFPTWDGLHLFDKKTKRRYSHSYNPFHHPLLQVMETKGLTHFFKDSDHNIWIASYSKPEFYKYSNTTKQVTVYSLSGMQVSREKYKERDVTSIVYCFFEDSHHNLWIGTQNAGLLKYNKDKDNFISIGSEKDNKNSIKFNYEIITIFEDREENIWLGTDRGITIFNPNRQYFQAISHIENNVNSIPKSEIQECIETANGDILAGTWGGGLTLYDNQRNFKKNIYLPGPFEYNLIWSFIQNDDGTIWAGCQHGYIHIYDPVRETIQTIHPPELNGYTIRCMTKDKAGNIWFGLHDGKIAKWDKSQNRFYPYNDILPGIDQNFAPVLCLLIDDKQNCWAGTENGFKQFDMDKRIFSAVYSREPPILGGNPSLREKDKKVPLSVSDNFIQCIEIFDDSTLVVGTKYGGLNFFNTNSKKFSHISVNDGLPSNTINAIKINAAKQLWFTTEYGLYKYIPLNKKIVHYNIEPGIITSSFKPGKFYELKDGRWIAITAKEIICFNPQDADRQNSSAAKVEITGFKIYDKAIFIDSILSENKPVHLGYKQNFLTIEFAALDFSGLQQQKYFYRLSEVNDDWVDGSTKRFADYTNLEPGNYTFYVKADNGNEASETTSFKIIITPPFWRTWWFKTLLVVLTIVFIYVLLKRRIKAIRHEAEMKQKIAETEMMALRAQMNPHFIFNCLNSIDNLIQNNEKEKATHYLSKFAKLIRSILETSKNNTVPCWKDLETLNLYLELEQLRWDKNFLYEVKIDEKIINGDYKVPPMIIQPFVENAIHHGLLNKKTGDKKLSIDVSVVNNHILYVIKDNGVGRKKAAEYKQLNRPTHQSLGLDITRDRINLFNNTSNGAVKITDLYDEHQQPAGTKVEVELINQ